MPTKVELTTLLDCNIEAAWKQANTSALLHHITSPLIRFVPKRGQEFPDVWDPREYRAWMLLFGFIPLGWQAIVISIPPQKGASRFVRDNGYSPMIRRWDHWIEISSEGKKTRYTDSVIIDAGILTPIVATFARVFYRHRQNRWRALAASNFAALPS